MSKQIKVDYIDTSSTYVPRDIALPPINKMSEEAQKYLDWATHMTTEAGEANSVQYLQTIVLLLPEFNETLIRRARTKSLFKAPQLDEEDLRSLSATLGIAFALNLFTYNEDRQRLELDLTSLKDQYTTVELDGKRYDMKEFKLTMTMLSLRFVHVLGKRVKEDVTPAKGDVHTHRGKHLAYLLAMASMHRDALEELAEV